MHSFPSFGQACFHGKMEPVADLVITDTGTFLLENMLSAERAARRVCVMTKANWEIVPNSIVDRMYMLCFPTWAWDWDKSSLKHVAPPLETNHFCCHLTAFHSILRPNALGRRVQISLSVSVSLSPILRPSTQFPKVQAHHEGQELVCPG